MLSLFRKIARLFLLTAVLEALTLPKAVAAPLRVVVSFTILKDFVKNIAPNAEVEAIVPVNMDPHTYQPTPSDARKIANAHLVIVNGLGFEGWFEKLVEASGYKGPLCFAAARVSPRKLKGPTGREALDPHAWHNAKHAILYIDEIERALVAVDPQNKEAYTQAAARYRDTLEKLHQEIEMQYKAIPQEKRVVITTHDAFWYYGEAYGIQFHAPVGISTEAEPSAAALAALISLVKEKNIKAIFIENLSNPRLVEQIAREAGTKVDGTLYADSLSVEEGPANTYQKMMRYNTAMILKNLY